MTTNPIWQWSATDIANAIRQGDVSCVEITEAAVDRLRKANPALNAVTVDLGDEALSHAKKADQVRAAGVELGPLHGVPVTIKENVDVQGQATPNGVKAFENVIAPDDSPVVKNLKEAGAIIIGRTNTPEFSFRAFTDNPLRGLTKNPWDPEITCGGSSGGAASSVAAGIGAIAHGNDIGGSLRIPSYCCGLSTIRPTFGRVPAYNPSAAEERPPMMQMMSVQGPIAREVRDVRLGLSVMAKGSPHDPWWVPAPLEGPALAAPLRVAVTKHSGGFSMHPGVSSAIDQAADHLADAGYAVEEVDPPQIEDVLALWSSMIFTEMKVMMDTAIREYGSEDMNQVVDAYYRFADIKDFDGYMRGSAQRSHHLREWMRFLDTYPLILAPLSLQPPFPVNHDLNGDEGMREVWEAFLYIASMNLLGLPAAVVPVSTHEKVSIGVQIIGQRFREDLCLDAAQVIENKTGIFAQKLWERED